MSEAVEVFCMNCENTPKMKWEGNQGMDGTEKDWFYCEKCKARVCLMRHYESDDNE